MGCGVKRAANHRSAFRWSDVVVVLVWPRCAIRPLQSTSLSLSFSTSPHPPVHPLRPTLSVSRSLFTVFSDSPRSVFLAEYQIPAIWVGGYFVEST